MATFRQLGLDVEWSAWQEDAARAGLARMDFDLADRVSLSIGHPSAPLLFTAQQFWDLLVYDLFFKGAPRRPRYFFEAGARDGVMESNTFFFERHLGWSGIMVEPSPLYKCALPFTRPRTTAVHGAFCTQSFRAKPYDAPRRGCEYNEADHWPTCFASWAALEHDYGLPRMDVWSLDIDNDDVQLQLMSQLNASSPSAPRVVVVECNSVVVCESMLESAGWSVLHLENNGKVKPGNPHYGDLLAWSDTCAAWH